MQSDGPGLVLAGHRIRWGSFWGGWGGSWETMNPDRRMTTAYVAVS